MNINVGQKLPNVTLKIMSEKGPADITVESLTEGKKVVIFAVPGAFTPGCSNTHLPGFVVKADEIKAKGVDSIICLSVNDAFVMSAWGKAQNAEELLMIADGNGEFTDALGLALDATGHGMGTRSKRYAMIVEDGTITHLAVDEKGIDGSSAESILAQL